MLENRLDYSADNCSLLRTLEIVGERWSLLVLREALLGLRRFEDFHAAIGCARNMLAARLTTLVHHGLLQRVAYREPASREREEYRLTEKGRDLATAIVALMQWGDRYAVDESGPALEIVHHDCGLPVRTCLVCERHGEVTTQQIRLRPGSGATRIGIRQRV